MGLIKGITIILYEKTQTGTDRFQRPVYEETPIKVKNVLVAPASAEAVTDQTNLTGKKAVYTIAIPKGDTHEWEDRTVEFFGKKWRTSGPVQEGIEDLIPLGWNKKVTVEEYGQ
jgi:hypothetical protein